MIFDIEKTTSDLYNFFFKYKYKFLFLILCLFGFASFFIIKKNNEYLDKVNSSNQLLDYIFQNKEDFLSNEHNNSYSFVKKLVIYKKNPEEAVFDYFASFDEYVFKDLFYFSKQMQNFKKDGAYNLYISKNNPWKDLFLFLSVDNGNLNDYFLMSEKDLAFPLMVGFKKEC